MSRAEDIFQKLIYFGEDAIDEFILNRQSEELFLDYDVFHVFRAIYVLCDNHKFYRIYPDILLSFLPMVNPLPEYPFF